MNQIINQSLGIDCSKKDFAVTFSVCDAMHEVSHRGSRSFSNNQSGFKGLRVWIDKHHKPDLPLICVIEATGVYHEELVHFLYHSGFKICVVLPKRAKDFSKTMKIKRVTDKIASQYLAVMGLEKKLDIWEQPDPIYFQIKRLHREKERIQNNITQLKNQLEAEQHSYYLNKDTVSRIKETLKLLNNQRRDVIKQIQAVINSNEELKKKAEKICSISGIGLLTVCAVLGETNGFNNFHNQRQLVSYAGYDIMNQESGTSVKTKARISKRGNKHIRKAMHMPALAAIRCDEHFRALFQRIFMRTGIKMKGVVAVQRKLLILLYTLWKNDMVYEREYIKERAAQGCPTS